MICKKDLASENLEAIIENELFQFIKKVPGGRRIFELQYLTRYDDREIRTTWNPEHREPDTPNGKSHGTLLSEFNGTTTQAGSERVIKESPQYLIQICTNYCRSCKEQR